MRLLVDTNIFIWSDRRPHAIPRQLMRELRNVGNGIFLSVASVWEIAIKRATGKLEFAGAIAETAERMGFQLLPITAAHAEYAGGLPRHHNDPFDRLIVAQAIVEDLVLGTSDRAMLPYGITTLGLGRPRA